MSIRKKQEAATLWEWVRPPPKFQFQYCIPDVFVPGMYFLDNCKTSYVRRIIWKCTYWYLAVYWYLVAAVELSFLLTSYLVLLYLKQWISRRSARAGELP